MADRTPFAVATVAALSVLVEVALLSAGLSLPLLVTAIVALTCLAVAVSFAWSMNLAGQPRLIKGFALIPIVFSAITILVLLLEARFHTGGWH